MNNTRFISPKKLILLFVALLMITSCNRTGTTQDPGADYIGKWENTRNHSDRIEIAKNGENFLVRKTSPRLLGGPPQTTAFPATLRDGILETHSGPLTATLTYVKATGRLTTRALSGGNVEYVRLK